MRPNWDLYFIGMARHAALRATCSRKHVGAVVVWERQVVSTGYNGSPRGLPHCSDVGCELKDLGGRQSCVRTVHAEANAIAQAARGGGTTDKATIYTTASPCLDCAKLIVNAGITRVVFGEAYAGRYGVGDSVGDMFKAAGIEMVHVPDGC
jgi:dCMP deaminase